MLAPHLGLLLLSLRDGLVLLPLPDGFTLAHYATRASATARSISRTRCSIAALAARIDVVLGTAIAYLVLRTRLPGRQRSTGRASRRWPFPASCSASAICAPSTASSCRRRHAARALWIVIVLAFAVRRLPYALRACIAALQQIHVSLEEAAENLGADQARAPCAAS